MPPQDPRRLPNPAMRAAVTQRPGYAGPIPQVDTGRPNPAIATAPAPGQTAIDNTTDIFTMITQVGVPVGKGLPVLYNGDRLWAQVTLTLETAGIVAVGTRADLTPLQSGKGYTLVPNVPKTYTIAKGTRLFYVASSVNRVTVSVEPLPWLEEITSLLRVATGAGVR